MWMAEVYAVGVLIGLAAAQGGAATRLGLALLWPLGPLAFIITVAGLLVVAALAYPLVGILLAAGAAAAWWFR
jgi:hypothetical protein